VCDGAPKLPGTWTASHPPGGNDDAHWRNNCWCPDTHCNVALLRTTSASGGIVQAATSSTRNETPSTGAAREIISGDESSPSTTADGQRAASSAVRFPGPHPRSTTRRGEACSIRATRSTNGRPRSSL